MKKRKLRLKDDVIIYGTLILAISFLFLGSTNYFESLEEKSSLPNEIKLAIYELQGKEITEKNNDIKEPTEIKKVEKEEIIIKYLDSLKDRILKDELINYDIIKTWDKYEIINMKYEREIAQNYFSYKTDIKIYNNNAKIPTKKNESLSKDDYIVLTLNANIYSDNNNLEVKNLSIPKEK